MMFGPWSWSGVLEEEKSLVFAKIQNTACSRSLYCAVPAVVLSDGAVSGSVYGLVQRIHCMIYFSAFPNLYVAGNNTYCSITQFLEF
jgi:hypothetical protein